MAKFNKTAVILLAIILAGLSIRIYDLGKESLWKDEAAVLYTAEKGSIAEVAESAIEMHRGHPPLNFVLLHFWVKLFGNSEFAARLPSAIFGTLSILLVFLVAKELFDKKTALLSSLLLSTSMIQLVYSQELKQYAMFAFFTLLSVYFFIRLLKKESAVNYSLYIVSAILLLYSHYFSLFVVLFENIAFLFFRGIDFKSLKKWVITQLAILATYIPLIPAIIGAIIISHPSIQTGLVFRGFPKWLAAPGVFYLIAPFAVGLVIVYFLIKNREKIKNAKMKFNPGIFFVFLIFFFGFLLLAEPHLTKPVYITKYAFFAFPVFYILFARGIMNLQKWYAVSIITLLIGVNLILISNYYTEPTKSQWREAAAFVGEKQGGQDIIVYSGELNILPFDYYYNGSLERIDFFTGEPFNENFLQYNNMLLPDAQEKLEKRFEGKKGAWVLISYGHNMTTPFMSWMNSKYELKLNQSYRDIEIYYYGLDGG